VCRVWCRVCLLSLKVGTSSVSLLMWPQFSITLAAWKYSMFCCYCRQGNFILLSTSESFCD
jgi:hypothetical protein